LDSAPLRLCVPFLRSVEGATNSLDHHRRAIPAVGLVSTLTGSYSATRDLHSPRRGCYTRGNETFEEPDVTSGSAGDWSAAVRPYVAKLAAHLSERGASEHSISVPLGASRLLVTPLEQQLALEEVSAPASDDERRLSLVRDGLGLRVKILADQRSLARAELAQRTEALRRLERDIGIGYDLLRAMHAEMMALTEASRLDDARQYQEFRSRLIETVRLAEGEIGGEPDLPEPASPPATSIRSTRKPAPPSPEVMEETPRSDGPRIGLRAKRRIAAGLVAILAVILVALFVTRQRELDQFTVEDFSSLEGVEQVVNRPPDLLVIFSETSWQSMTAEGRHQAATRVGEVIGPAGYRRGILRTAQRPRLAEWHRRGGVTVNE